MCKFIGKCNEWFSCKLSKSEMLSLYSIVHVAMETTKKSHFTCPSKSFISIFFTCQVSACELQSFSCHDLANDIYSQTAKTVFSHLKYPKISKNGNPLFFPVFPLIDNFCMLYTWSESILAFSDLYIMNHSKKVFLAFLRVYVNQTHLVLSMLVLPVMHAHIK